MQRRLLCLALIGAAIMATAGSALATQSQGFTSTNLGKGNFAKIDIASFFISEKGKPWLLWMQTKGKSDGYVLTNTWVPGGTTGWHTHPGPTFIIVTSGAITHYDGDDPTCTPHVYTAGMTFVDRGGDHVHLVRNEGTSDALAVGFRLLPQGQPTRVDAPDPGTCHF